MRVFKFGGASVKDAEGIRNLAGIVSQQTDNLIIVVSAFGKTTNALEKYLQAWMSGSNLHHNLLDDIYRKHTAVVQELSMENSDTLTRLDDAFGALRKYVSGEKSRNYDYNYDQVVSYGEIWSTIIVAGYLKALSLDVEWIDIRKTLLTDNFYRDANILAEESIARIRATFSFKKHKIFLTQGFIGGTTDGKTTTLGREGSDYTAALLANFMDAECAVVWKDVPGILNADPDWFEGAEKLDEISYKEAVEVTFSGAKVIHPKTIKPLQNKNIPLHVRSFLHPEGSGTVIRAGAKLTREIPFFIKKENQLLISILPRDFSFVMGEKLSMIFQLFIRHGIKVNLVEASAISLDVCVDDERSRIYALIEDLKHDYSAVYNENTELMTIRHYTPAALGQITKGREVLIEQRTRSTARYVLRK